MIALTSVNDTIVLQTVNAISTDYVVNYGDQNNATSSFTPDSNQGNVSTATTTTIIAAPGSGVQRLVKSIIVTNRGVSSQQVQFWKVVSGNSYAISEVITIAAGYNLRINQNGDFILNTGSSGGMDSPMTTLGDIIIGKAAGVADRLAGNTSTTPAILTSTGSGSAANIPAWTLTTNINVGSANALVSPVTTGLVEVTGMSAGQTRVKTVTDANDTLLELNGGPYSVTGLWTFTQKVTAQSFHGFPLTRKLMSNQVLDDYASVVIQGPLLMNGYSITMGVGSVLRIMV
jgi:hypothetical protein